MTWVQVLTLPVAIPISPNTPLTVYLDRKMKSNANQTSCSKLFSVLLPSIPTRHASLHPSPTASSAWRTMQTSGGHCGPLYKGSICPFLRSATLWELLLVLKDPDQIHLCSQCAMIYIYHYWNNLLHFFPHLLNIHTLSCIFLSRSGILLHT